MTCDGTCRGTISTMPSLDERMRSHPGNARILTWLGVRPEDSLRAFHGLGFDEGGVSFVTRLGCRLPDEAKLTLGICNVMLHPGTGLIIAVHRGRFTILLRWPQGQDQRQDQGQGRQRDVIETLDGTVDLSPLEPEWDRWFVEEDEDLDPLDEAYAQAGAADR